MGTNGLLDDIEDSTKKTGMQAVLLENQATQLIKELSNWYWWFKRRMEWCCLPLVRRIFGEISAQEFVSVQPMNLPSGLIFFLDFKYGSANQANIDQNSDIFGNTSGSGDASGGLYGGGKSGYSINDKSALSLNVGSEIVTASATWKEVEFEPDLSASIHAGEIIKVTVGQQHFTRPDFDGVKAWEISGSTITLLILSIQFLMM